MDKTSLNPNACFGKLNTFIRKILFDDSFFMWLQAVIILSYQVTKISSLTKSIKQRLWEQK